MIKYILILVNIICINCAIRGQGSCASPDGSFFDYTGGNITYATANSNGWCLNSLVANSIYCFSYKHPFSGIVEIDWNVNGCGTCSNFYISTSATGGSCSSIGGSCSLKEYNESCTFLWNGIKVGGSCPNTSGQIYTLCFTVPSTCGGMSVCPTIRCSAGLCGSTVLPINLLSADISCHENYVKIKWLVASEVNNDRFEIHQVNASSKIVHIVYGRGTTNLVKEYSLIIPKGYHNDSISVYSLYQVDFDGRTEYLESLSCSKNNNDKKIKTIEWLTITGQEIDIKNLTILPKGFYLKKIIYENDKIDIIKILIQ